MDRLDSLANTISGMSIYDIKAMYNQVYQQSRPSSLPSHLPQARNAVLNISEMEAKVKDATSDEPWYACTHSLQHPYPHPYLQGSKFDLDAGDRSRVSTVTPTSPSRLLIQK